VRGELLRRLQLEGQDGLADDVTFIVLRLKLPRKSEQRAEPVAAAS
jgi:hypothetical protein